MPKEISLDFTAFARRKKQTDGDAVCMHDPECWIWDSVTEGSVPVCNLGDWHLINAYLKCLDKIIDSLSSPNSDMDWHEAELELAREIEARLLWSEVRRRQ